MRFGSLTVNGKSVVISLATLLALVAVACGSDDAPASGGEFPTVPVPAVGSVPELTAQQILERAIEAADPITSVRGVGEFIGYGSDGVRQATNQTFEWLAPNRIRQQYTSIETDEYTTSEFVIIGSQFYQRTDAGPW